MIIRMWKRDELVSDIAVAVGRKAPTVQAYIYALIVKGELQKRPKARKTIFNAEGETGIEGEDDLGPGEEE